MVVKHHHLLGIHKGIVKLYPRGKIFLISVEMEATYFITQACQDLQTEGDAKNKIVCSTMQK